MSADTPIDIPDDGFLTFKINGVEQTIDAYAVWSRVTDFQRECEDTDRPHDFQAKVAKFLADEVGFGKVSLYAADAFVKALSDRVDALGKALWGEPTPGSPAPTEQPS